MKKPAKIVLLATQNKSNICLLKSNKLNYGAEFISSSNTTAQHLYILSDDEIKEGDWVLYGEDSIMQVKSSYDNDVTGDDIWLGDSLNGLATQKNFCKKVITTTDKLLKSDWVYKNNIIPQIPQSFIEYFITEYNKGNIITDVMVEYEYSNRLNGDGESIGFKVHEPVKLKLNPDNTINISTAKNHIINDFTKELKKEFSDVNLDYLDFAADRFVNNISAVKDSWTREEVHNLMMQAWIFGESKPNQHYSIREKWIEDNLK